MVIDKLDVCFEKRIGIYLENLYSLEWITISRAKFKLKVSVEIREISFDRLGKFEISTFSENLHDKKHEV